MSGKFLRATLLGTTALLMLQTSGAIARVGVTSAVSGDPLGKPPELPERVLRIGIDVQANELVTTTANDRAHLVFLDGTSVTVGPNASLKIDKFVYDPASKKGELSMTAGKGVFRLVGGKISKTNSITVNTPSSTIGIRGGITIFTVTEVRTTSTFVFGDKMTVTGQGQTQTATRPGSQVTTNQGQSPGTPTLVPPGGLSNSMNQLEGGGNQGGGGGNPPGSNPQQAENNASNFSGHNSGQGPQGGQPPPPPQPSGNQNNQQNAVNNANQQQNQNQQQTTTPKVIVSQGRFLKQDTHTGFDNNTLAATRTFTNNQFLQTTGSVLNNQATITTQDGRSLVLPWLQGQTFTFVGNSDTGVADGVGIVGKDGEFFAYVLTNRSDSKKSGVFGGTPTTTAQFPTAGFAAYTLYNLSEMGGMPFAVETIATNSDLKSSAIVSKLYSVYSTNMAPGGSPANQGAQAFQVTLSISGTGANQKSYMGAFVGDYYRDMNNGANSNFLSGGYTGTYRVGFAAPIGRLTSAVSTAETPSGNAIYGPNAEAMVFMNDGLRTSVTGNTGTTTRTPQLAYNQPYNDLTGSGYFSLNAAVKDNSTTIGADLRQTRTMEGYSGGLIEGRDANGTFTTRMPDALSMEANDTKIETNASTNRAQGTIIIRRMTSDPFNASDPSTPKRTFELGDTTGSRSATSAFINDNIYGMRDSADVTRPSKVTINGADTLITSRTVLTSYNSAAIDANNTALFWQQQGVTPCECSFMSWGWWSGDVRYDNAGYRTGERDRMHLYSYVVGNLTPQLSMPQTGTATYAGHMVGNVSTNGNGYVAAGSFSQSWNFGSQSGTFGGTFDSVGFSGSVSAIGGTNGRDFSGAITGTSNASYTGSVKGSFFSTTPTSGHAQGVGGAFNLSNPAANNYMASGTFAGQKQP